MSRAGSDLMDMIHGLVADSLRSELENAFKLANHQDPDKRVPMNPQLIDKAMKFLKDNGIDSPLGNPKVDTLATKLASLNVDVEGEAQRLN